MWTPQAIKERLKAKGNPSIFEEATLAYIEELELRCNALMKSIKELYNTEALLIDLREDEKQG